MSHVCRQLAFFGKEATFKIQPTFPPFKDEEYRPRSPCARCFSEHTANITLLGVTDLFLANGGSWKGIVLRHVLQNYLGSIQIHRGELEYLHQLRLPQILIAKYQSSWDIWIFSYLANFLDKVPIFVNNIPHVPKLLSHFNKSNVKSQIIRIFFVNMEDSEKILSSILKEITDLEETDFIPVSLCYEFLPDNLNLSPIWTPLRSGCELPPNVRINFGVKHSFTSYIGKGDEKYPTFMGHLTHEIWKNTSVMPFHIASIIQYHPRVNSEQSKDLLKKSLDEFQKQFRREHDVAFVGHIDHVSEYCLNVMSKKPFAFCTKAVDLFKFESMMMKAVLSVIDRSKVDQHNETHKISNDAVILKFQLLTKILEQEISHIHPPCTEHTDLEKQALNLLIEKSIISYHSDEFFSAENILAHRMARNFDLEFHDDDDDEEDWANLAPPAQDVALYVNMKNLLDRQWVSSIVNQYLEVYYVAAKQLLVFEKVDVMEDEQFVNSVLQTLKESFRGTRPKSGELRELVHNSLKLFTKLEIIGSYCHSGIKVIYLKDTHSTEGQQLQLIDDIAQFVN